MPIGWTLTTGRNTPPLEQSHWLSLLGPGLVWPYELMSGVGSAIQKTPFMPISPPDRVPSSHAQLRNLPSKMLVSFGLLQNAVCFKQGKLDRKWGFLNNVYRNYVFLLLLKSMIHSLRFSFLRRHFRPVLVATSHLWLSICKYIKMKENVNSALQLYWSHFKCSIITCG